MAVGAKKKGRKTNLRFKFYNNNFRILDGIIRIFFFFASKNPLC